VATHDKEKNKRGKSAPHLKKDNKLSIKKYDNKDTCFFCKKNGHMKKEKKGNIIFLVCHKSFFVEAPCNTWWIDYGSTIHIVNTM